ncbi:hypothetical protein SAMN04487969_13222 [Paenibacillus algorifonticola]|uniref:Uncharacterized protein n=1 Tax=Paenibacillus algorifonticola TaxID=684063 RepID=A0A1I2I925_9BACL|nr:hypothetical protein [Paenibacillus algorifonticola]SFF38734.1 hypothetical protein SAMN04487969_13222 [Paenibacillus algorifonticola]
MSIKKNVRRVAVAALASTIFLSGATFTGLTQGDLSPAAVQAYGETLHVQGPDGLTYTVAFYADELFVTRDGGTEWIDRQIPPRHMNYRFDQASLVSAHFNGNNLVAWVRWPGLVSYTSTFLNITSKSDRLVIKEGDPYTNIRYISFSNLGNTRNIEYYYQFGDTGAWVKTNKQSTITVRENVKINMKAILVNTGEIIATDSHQVSTIQMHGSTLSGPDGKSYKVSRVSGTNIEVRNTQNVLLANYQIPQGVYENIDYLQYFYWEGNDLIVTGYARNYDNGTSRYITMRFNNLPALNPN